MKKYEFTVSSTYPENALSEIFAETVEDAIEQAISFAASFCDPRFCSSYTLREVSDDIDIPNFRTLLVKAHEALRVTQERQNRAEQDRWREQDRLAFQARVRAEYNEPEYEAPKL